MKIKVILWKLKYIIKQYGKIIGYSLSKIGLGCFFFGAIISSGVRYNGELPLGDIEGIVVDRSGKIYIGTGFYSVVQVYDRNGEFIRNWPVDCNSGSFKIELTEKQEVLITTARWDKQLKYNEYGHLLSEEIIKNAYSKAPKYKNKFVGRNGEKYQHNRLLRNKIIKLTPEPKTIIKQNLFLEFIKGPRCLLLSLFGMLILYLNERYKTKYEIENQG